MPRPDAFSKITEYNINTQKSFANLWFAGDQTESQEIEVKNTVTFRVTSKKIKYFTLVDTEQTTNRISMLKM